MLPAAKTQELFMRWLALPDVQVSLKNDIDKLVHNTWAPADSALQSAGELGTEKKAVFCHPQSRFSGFLFGSPACYSVAVDIER